MQSQTIELLSVKGKFTTEQAVTFATAIDMEIQKAQLVTIPILDARFAAVDVRFAAVDARFAAVDSQFAALEARLAERFAAIDVRFAAIDERFAALEAKIDLKIQRLIIIMVLSQTVLGPIGMQALSALRQALSAFAH